MRIALFPLLFLLSWPAFAWQESLSLPAAAPVVDEFGLLPAGDSQRIENVLQAVKARSGIEISVFIPRDLRERTIEEVGIAVADQWKLGSKKEDKAMIFIVAPNEKKMRFEVGYGLEGEITDAFSRRVLDSVVKPYFQAGRYGDGILAGLMALQEKVPLGLREDEAPAARAPMGSRGISGLVWFFLIAFVILSIVGRMMGFSSPGYRRYGRRGWGGGGGFGGFGGGGGSSWGGGGGGFGGGGASSSW